jgi:hypothetical protein
MAQVSNSQGVFTGINELHVVKGGFGDRFTLPTGVTAVEVPVAEDSGFSYTGGTPSIERYRIHGLSTPWSAKMTPGDAETNLFIPQVTEALLELFGFTTSQLSIQAGALGTDTELGKKWKGVIFADSAHEVNLGIAAINRTVDQMFAIKKNTFLAAIVFDDVASAKPIGIQLSGVSTGGSDTDAMGIFEVDNE